MICFINLCEVCAKAIAVCAHAKLGAMSAKAVGGGLGKGGTVKCIMTSVLVIYAIITQEVYFCARNMCYSAESQ